MKEYKGLIISQIYICITEFFLKKHDTNWKLLTLYSTHILTYLYSTKHVTETYKKNPEKAKFQWKSA